MLDKQSNPIDRRTQVFAHGKPLDPNAYRESERVCGIDLRQAELGAAANFPPKGELWNRRSIQQLINRQMAGRMQRRKIAMRTTASRRDLARRC